MTDVTPTNNANQTESGSWFDVDIAKLASDAEAMVAAAGNYVSSTASDAYVAASDVYDSAANVVGDVCDNLVESGSTLYDWATSDDTQTIPVPPSNQIQNQYVEVVHADTPIEPVRAIEPVAARVHDEPGMMERARNAIVGSVRGAYDYVDSTAVGGAIIDGYQFFIPDAVEDYVVSYFPPTEVNQVASPQVAQVQSSQAPEEPGLLDRALGFAKSIIKAVTPDVVEETVASWLGYPPAEEMIVVVGVSQGEATQPVAAASTNPPAAAPTQTQQARSGAEASRSSERVASSMQQGAADVPTGFETPDYVSYYEEDFVTEDAFAMAAEPPAPSAPTEDEPVDFTTGGTEVETALATLAPVDGEEVSEGEEEVLETEARSAVVATLTTEENDSDEAGGVVVGASSPAALALANGTSTFPTGTRKAVEGKTSSIAPKPLSPNEPLEDFDGSSGNSALASHDQSEGDAVVSISFVEKGDLEPGVENKTVLVVNNDERKELAGVAEIVEALPPQVSVQPHGVLLTQVMDQAAARDAQTPDNPKMVAAYVGPRQAGVLADSGNDGDGGRVSHAAGEVYVRGNMNVSDEGGNSNRDGRDKTTEDIYAYADWLASRNTSWGRSATTISKRQSTV